MMTYNSGMALLDGFYLANTLNTDRLFLSSRTAPSQPAASANLLGS
jgi:hypothetical protein